MVFGIAAPVMLAAGGMAIDFGLVTVQKNKMQNAVDAATLAAGEELQVSSTSKAQILAVAKQVLEMNLGKYGDRVSVTVDVGANAESVTV
ncbi:MAG: pilus assembly protein, partial [bacterium]|nr:pilus assembly protein [bacterium]